MQIQARKGHKNLRNFRSAPEGIFSITQAQKPADLVSRLRRLCALDNLQN